MHYIESNFCIATPCCCLEKSKTFSFQICWLNLRLKDRKSWKTGWGDRMSWHTSACIRWLFSQQNCIHTDSNLETRTIIIGGYHRVSQWSTSWSTWSLVVRRAGSLIYIRTICSLLYERSQGALLYTLKRFRQIKKIFWLFLFTQLFTRVVYTGCRLNTDENRRWER